jgi:hypothetical protein
MKVFILCCLLVIFFMPLFADTNHNTDITSNETWSPGGNSHIVTASINVIAGVTLTIEAGCIVKFDSNKSINVSGTLNAPGISGNGISFELNGTGSNWNYIYYQNNGQGTLSYCTFENSNRGIYGYNANLVIADYCNFYDNDYGSWIYNTPVVFTDCSFQNNNRGIFMDACTAPALGTGNDFSGNTTGVYIRNSTDPSIALLQPVSGNANGIRFQNCSNPVIAAGNSFTGNTSYGLFFEDCSGLGTLDNFTFTGNEGNGAMLIKNSGDFLLGVNNTISDNEWPLTINCGSFPDAASVIPTTGNTNNDIRVTSGSSDKTGTWPDFVDLDYVVTDTSINVSGTLNAPGALRSGINFVLNDTTGSNWSYIYYQNNGQGTLSYCTFENSNRGIHGYNANLVTADHCSFYNNDNGSWIYQSDWEYTHCSFQNNDTGIHIQNSSPSIHNCEIINNIEYGLKLQNNSIPNLGNVVTEGNDIYNNGTYNIYNGTEDISAKYTYWGTDYPAGIDYTIWDHYDNEALGIVDYEPWSNASHTLMLSLGTSPSDIFINYDTGNVVLNWTVSPDATYYVVLSSPVPYVEDHIWVEVATEIYTTSWSKIPDAEKEYFVVISIIAE